MKKKPSHDRDQREVSICTHANCEKTDLARQSRVPSNNAARFPCEKHVYLKVSLHRPDGAVRLGKTVLSAGMASGEKTQRDVESDEEIDGMTSDELFMFHSRHFVRGLRTQLSRQRLGRVDRFLEFQVVAMQATSPDPTPRQESCTLQEALKAYLSDNVQSCCGLNSTITDWTYGVTSRTWKCIRQCSTTTIKVSISSEKFLADAVWLPVFAR